MGLWLRILVVGLVAGLMASLAAPMAAFPGVNGRIAFTTFRDGDNEIYSMNGDGTDEANLSNIPPARIRGARST